METNIHKYQWKGAGEMDREQIECMYHFLVMESCLK